MLRTGKSTRLLCKPCNSASTILDPRRRAAAPSSVVDERGDATTSRGEPNNISICIVDVLIGQVLRPSETWLFGVLAVRVEISSVRVETASFRLFANLNARRQLYRLRVQ